METPRDQKVHFRHLLFYGFRRGLNACETAREICAVYGEARVSNRIAQEWFAKFRMGCCDLEDAPRSGRPVEFDEDRLKALLKEDPRQTQRELAEKMGCDQTTICNHLASMEFTQKLGVWSPATST